jgi:hypothetical protein
LETILCCGLKLAAQPQSKSQAHRREVGDFPHIEAAEPPEYAASFVPANGLRD